MIVRRNLVSRIVLVWFISRSLLGAVRLAGFCWRQFAKKLSGARLTTPPKPLLSYCQSSGGASAAGHRAILVMGSWVSLARVS
jgi:hypothetical protein